MYKKKFKKQVLYKKINIIKLNTIDKNINILISVFI